MKMKTPTNSKDNKQHKTVKMSVKTTGTWTAHASAPLRIRITFEIDPADCALGPVGVARAAQVIRPALEAVRLDLETMLTASPNDVANTIAATAMNAGIITEAKRGAFTDALNAKSLALPDVILNVLQQATRRQG
jgi:hypothetical protein